MTQDNTLTMTQAMEKRNDIDYRSYQLLVNEILPFIQYNEDFKSCYDSARDWEGATDDLLKSIATIQKDRMYANEDIADAIKNNRF